MPPTPYAELNAVLDELVAGVRGSLAETLVGVYLQGSFAAGDFDRDSDVDFIVVTNRELPEHTVEALQPVHRRVFGLESEWAKHLEGSYFPADVLRSCARRGEPLWYLEHGDSSLVRSEHCNTAVVRWVVREHGIALVGPTPASLVDPVTVETLNDEVLETMRDWGREIIEEPERFNNRFYQSFVVLSYCRMLYGLSTGRVESKRAGAEWALTALDSSWAGLIERSWDGRPDPSSSIRQPADPDDFSRTLEFVGYAMASGDAFDVRRVAASGLPRDTDRTEPSV